MYNVKDNAESKLQVGVSPWTTTIILEIGTWILFPEAPFILILNKRDESWKVTKFEKVEVTDKQWDQLTVNRGFDWTTPTSFSAGDYASLFILARHIQDLQEWLKGSSKSTSIADLYSNEAVYSVWDIVIYEWERYKCNIDIIEAEDFNPNKWSKVNIQSDLNSINTTVEYTYNELEDIKTNWVLTPHIAENLCIWEVYNANDKLYLLHIPKNTDSWDIAYAIWDVDARKSLHIQMIWSWKLTNTLTMKIRNIWSPTTTLICEIQKWETVDVSATEKARYWDWTTIATGSLSYSNFNHQWSIVTFTFDNEFWEIRWELLDIIIHQQEEIVNSSNYYEIACDSTQYSEALRLIAVNWTTRTYTKFMPYIESNWFEKVVVARQKSGNYTASAVVTLSQYFSGSTSSWYSEISYTPSSLTVNTTLLRWKIVYNNSRLQTTMKVWSNTIFSRNNWVTQWETAKASWDTIAFTWYKNSGWSSTFTTDFNFHYYITQNSNIAPKNNLPSVMIQWVYTLWTIAKTILFWLINKDIRWDWWYWNLGSS